jgi:glycosyltransferase involved in cell wall biosynthesis
LFFWKLNSLHLRGRRWDVIHVHNFPDLLVFAAIIQKALGARIVLDVHDPMPELFQSRFDLGATHWLTRVLRLEERLSVALVDAVIAANHRFAALLAERGCPERKLTVVMNAPDAGFVDQPYGAAVSSGTRFEVLYIGTVAPRYGLEVAIEAIARLRRDGSIPNLAFTIVPKLSDEGDHLRWLVRRSEALGLSTCFQVEDPRPHHEMPDRIRRASVSVYPARSDVHMDIALSLKIPEVVAVGIPLVASRLPVLLDYFGEDALFLFQPGNVEECADRILEVYRSPEEVKVRMERARRALNRFAWSGGELVYHRLLQDLVGLGSAR